VDVRRFAVYVTKDSRLAMVDVSAGDPYRAIQLAAEYNGINPPYDGIASLQDPQNDDELHRAWRYDGTGE
jgi:hypothetical protein